MNNTLDELEQEERRLMAELARVQDRLAAVRLAYALALDKIEERRNRNLARDPAP